MKIKVRCDCGKTLVAPDRLAGKKARCPSCGAVIRLPQRDAEPEQCANFVVTETEWNLPSMTTTEGPDGELAAAWFPETETERSESVLDDDEDERHPDDAQLGVNACVFSALRDPDPDTAAIAPLDAVFSWLLERFKASWDGLQIEKPRRAIVGVAIGLVSICAVLPFFLGGRGEPIRRELKTEEIVTRSEAAVAFIQGVRGSGSGFLISTGLVMTNAHVLEDEFMENVEIHFPSATANDKGPFKAQLVYEDSQRDLAIVAINSNATPLMLSEAFEFRRGQDITVIGSPGVGGHVLKNAISRGVMSTETEINSQKFYQLGIAINPGNSGGPVFDCYGDVVGVVTARASEQEGLAFSVPLSDVRSILAIATQPGTGVIEKAISRHQLAVVARRIALVSRILLLASHAYADEVDIAIKQPRRRGVFGLDLQHADDFLNETVAAINVRLVDSGERALVPKTRAELFSVQYAPDPALALRQKVLGDRNLSEVVRTQFVDLWTNYSEIRKKLYSYDISVGVSEYRRKIRQLEEQHKRAVDALMVSLGLTDL